MLQTEFSVAGRPVGPEHPPYLIAEIGANFDQSLTTALRLMDVIAAAGADAVKFQLFRADAMQPPGTELHRIFKSLELNPRWVADLAAAARERGLAFLASAFDLDSLGVLEQAGVPAHKIASSEALNFPLLEAMAATGKPLFLATGMCDLVDVAEAVDLLTRRGNRTVAVMQCAALYPLPPAAAHLRVMDTFRAVFGGPVGFSDHSLGITLALAAAGRGACVIEKHVTLDRNSPGPDHFYALEPGELKALADGLRMVHAALGRPVKLPHPEEMATGRRPGLHALRDLPAGHRITAADLEVRRPAPGLRARHRDQVVGAVIRRPVAGGAPIQWEDLIFQEPQRTE
ncbi:MAG: N-acetylneuraminate synthase family protein [Magnetococcales bacterium]|nr:N-acetylneuraminate synthase family protein [Magnetococcales bacterium]